MIGSQRYAIGNADCVTHDGCPSAYRTQLGLSQSEAVDIYVSSPVRFRSPLQLDAYTDFARLRMTAVGQKAASFGSGALLLAATICSFDFRLDMTGKIWANTKSLRISRRFENSPRYDLYKCIAGNASLKHTLAIHRRETLLASQVGWLQIYEALQQVGLQAYETLSGKCDMATTGKLFGYARVSTDDQDTAIQEAALGVAGCLTVFSEKQSGTTTAGRSELRRVLDILSKGDVLVVTRIDRLARSIADLSQIAAEINTKGAHLRATEQPIDTSTPAGRAFLQMLGVFAEFETAIRRERQLEGIAKAKVAGVYKGRPITIDEAKVRELHAEGNGATDIAKVLNIGRASVYRIIKGDALPGSV